MYNSDKNSLERVCGDCQACCYAPRLDELNKPAFTRCINQGQGECTDYENRPEPCRDYQCTWLLGFGDEEDRPNKLGVMFTARSHPELGPWVSAHVLDREALGRKRFKKALVELTERCTVIEILKDEMFVMGGPDEQIEMFLQHTVKDLVPVQNLIPASSLMRAR